MSDIERKNRLGDAFEIMESEHSVLCHEGVEKVSKKTHLVYDFIGKLRPFSATFQKDVSSDG